MENPRKCCNSLIVEGVGQEWTASTFPSSIFTDMGAVELDCGLVKGAFFHFEEELMFSQLLEELQNMLVMFSHGLLLH